MPGKSQTAAALFGEGGKNERSANAREPGGFTLKTCISTLYCKAVPATAPARGPMPCAYQNEFQPFCFWCRLLALPMSARSEAKLSYSGALLPHAPRACPWAVGVLAQLAAELVQ